MEKIRVLFVCIHNSARSQMAEALLQQLGGEKFSVQSAGLEPGVLNPLAIAAMREMGIDISGHATKSVFELFKAGQPYDYVITVCDEAQAERCPVFPGVRRQLHWGFADPSSFQGTAEEKLAATIKVRDQIAATIRAWLKEVS